MATGFSERLRDSMIARDISCTEELAVRCRLPISIVDRWLKTEGESMTLRECLTLRRVLGVRGEWLLDAVGSMVSLQHRRCIAEAVSLMEGLPADKAEFLVHTIRRWRRR